MTDQDDPQSLEQLSRWLTVPLFLYCLGCWIRTQSDVLEFGGTPHLSHDVAVVVGLFATPVALVSLWLAARYASLHYRRRCPERVPRVLKNGLGGKTGQIFRLGLFLGMWFVILGSQVHFAHLVLTGSVIDTTPISSVPFATGPIEMLTKLPSRAAWSHDFRFGNEHGLTYFPVIETWLWLLAVSALLISFVGYLIWRLQLLKP